MCRFFGVPETTSYRELVLVFKDRFNKPVKPVTVASGPVKENILRGAQIDLFQLPVPKWNPHDGGRTSDFGEQSLPAIPIAVCSTSAPTAA